MNPELIALAKLGEEAQRVWTQAAKEGLGYVLLVKKNNPRTPLRKVMSRPDVQEALRYAGVQAARMVQESITKAWVAGGGDSSSLYLKQLIRDSRANGRTFQAMAKALLKSPDGTDLKKLVAKYALRQAAGQAVAITRAKGEAALEEAKRKKAKYVVWETTSANPCDECRALNGTRVRVGREFPHFAGGRRLRVFLNLICPPRHPLCRCRLRPI